MKKQVVSKHAVVRWLMRVRVPAVWLFQFMPKWVVAWLFRWFRQSESVIGFGVRYLALTRLLKMCGEKVIIFPYVYLIEPENLEIGTNVSIHQFSYIDAEGGIRIGDDVAIAHNCSILSADRCIDDIGTPLKDAGSLCRPVVIESNVWVGCGVRILKGVHIGTGSVIGAGSVVTRDIPPGSVAMGAPARAVRRRGRRGKAGCYAEEGGFS